MRIESIALWRVRVPLYTPYNTTLAALAELDSIIAEVKDADGNIGIGETTIIPGYTHETGDGGWNFCREQGRALAGMDSGAAKTTLDPYRKSDPHAVSVLQVAIEMVEGNTIFDPPDAPLPVPILTPVNSKDLAEIPDEIERHIADGFRTLKVKVGWDVDKDLERVALIQKVNAGRAMLRLDANQGFSEEDGKRFAAALNPDSITLFEQPCDCDDWPANAAVAAVSTVPVMMDESIYGVEDIDCAADMPGCGFVKLKIAKLTGVDMLTDGLNRIKQRGLGAVLGNGAATDIECWIEACVARSTIDNAGENCGFLKNREQLLETPLTFENGAIVLQPGYTARLNHEVVERLAVAKNVFRAESATAE